MSSEQYRRWILASRPDGKPTVDDFELETAPIPEPHHDELLVRTLYMSVDPYMRGRMRDSESYAEPWSVGDVMSAGVVGEVIESKHDAYDVGDIVTDRGEWGEYSLLDGDAVMPVDPDHAPISTALGVLGMPGRTAYFGLLEVGDPSPGETVVVSGAAGAVGSVVGQIAKLGGCEVVGIAGSDGKTAWLTDELGFDAAINYATEDVGARLDATCPDGIDLYFDNVGGEITDAVLDRLALRGRVAVCGQIALYNEEGTPTGPRHLSKLISKRARIEGFLVSDYADRYADANAQLGEWVSSGAIDYRETVTEGLENAPEAFIGLFEGENIGKQLVHVADPEE
ncbi:MAG: NADP-dependent oxidoreductase [Halobacteriales archaeon]|nr:NADP-dependent oxidoreductase [Halobacteriales archaeon]